MTAAGRRPGRPPSLTREEVARAALAEGLDPLSMPSVARRLGVSHSTLYHYVDDRADLLFAALEVAVAEHPWPAPDLTWRPLLQAFADALWALLDAHPGMAAVYGLVPAPEQWTDVVGGYAARLRGQGFTSRDAAVALDFLVDLVFSTVLAMRGLDVVEQTPTGPRTRRELHREALRRLAAVTPEIDDDDTWRGRGWSQDKLDMMLDGLELRLHRAH